jgi:hypothetical protein
MTDNTNQTPVAIPALSEQRIALAIMILRAMEGARYKIVLPDGRVFSKDLEEAESRPAFELEPAEKRTRKSKAVRGAMLPYYEKQVKSMRVGDVLVLQPPEGFDPDSLRGACAALGVRVFGKGSTQTFMNRENGTIEVLRQS